MRNSWTCLAVALLVGIGTVAQTVAAESSDFRGRIWVQPAFGTATGDDMVTSDVPADVGVTGIPIIGPISVTIPVLAEVEFEDPVGITFGASAGVSFEVFDRWSLVGNVQYFNGDEVELPSSSAVETPHS